MGAILDLLGSAIIAGLLLLMLLSVNNNVSEFTILNGQSTTTQENLMELATEVEYDFRKIGFRVSNPNTAIIACDSASISFRSDIDNNMTLDTVSYSLGATSQMTSTVNPNDRKLIRQVNGTSITSSLGLTAFQLRFFDANGNFTDVMLELMRKLLAMRVRPYYLYQADITKGANHFRTPVSVGLDIMDKLRGHTSGLAIPYYVIDAPGGGGKIPLLPQYVLGRNGNQIILRNYKYDIYTYPDVEEEPRTPTPMVERKFIRKKARLVKVYEPDKMHE